MQKLRTYISMLMLALLLFPMVEKAMHEIEHLDDKHCGIKDTHFCEVEHSCTICDYYFASPLPLQQDEAQVKVCLQFVDCGLTVFISNTTISPKYTFSLRGPPIC
jgi:hypothetical protein